MSYSFLVKSIRAPNAGELLQRVGLEDMVVVNEAEVAAWPKTPLQLCRRERSTRGVCVSYAGGEIDVKTNVLSATEDYELALRLTAVAAEMAGAQPRGEYTDPMPVDELRKAHDSAWIRSSQLSGLRSIRVLVKEEKTLGLPGPFRSCYVGPRVLTQLGEDDEAAVEGLLKLMRRVQWIESEGYDAASDFLIGGGEEHMAIWFASKRMFLPSVQWITLGESEPLIVFPFARLTELIGPLVLVDECQPLIEAILPDAISNLIARARPMATSPTGKTRGPASASPGPAKANPAGKPWWKIW